jgi:hypothetical protein
MQLFHHPQRGAALVDGGHPGGYLHYRGGRDGDWRAIGMFEVVLVNGLVRPAPGTRPPNRFLWGDPERQVFGLGGPVLVFGPLDKVCRDCREPFVWTAREQKHLAETLRLFIDATTVRCGPCRRARLTLERARKVYAEALRAAETAPDAASCLAAARAAVDVVDAGGRASLERAVALCRRARRLGARSAADRLEEAIARRRRLG